MNLHSVTTTAPPVELVGTLDEDDQPCQWCFEPRDDCWCCGECGETAWENVYYLDARRRTVIDVPNGVQDEGENEVVDTVDQDGWHCANCGARPTTDDLYDRLCDR